MNIPEANLRNMLAAISAGNHVLNEKVRFYKQSTIDCPDCEYDPVRGESTDYDCDTCDGKGNIITDTYQEISASVETESDYEFHYTKAGRLTKNQILLNIDSKEILEILNVNPTYDLYDRPQLEAFIDQYSHITWMGGKYNINSYEPGVLQGNMYEIALVLSLVE